MDGSRFDAFTRLLGSDTRRSVLQLFTATALGGALLGASGAEDAGAKCVNPGKKCKKKNGKKKKCCGGANCKGKKCKCPNGGFGCGSSCCAPGQVCENAVSSTCVNGPLDPGDICEPEKPLECNSGRCECFTLGELTQCTCREETCESLGQPCMNTSQCCEGGCNAMSQCEQF